MCKHPSPSSWSKQQDSSPSSPGGPTAERPASLLPATDWIPLDEAVQFWTDLLTQTSSALALQAIGWAILALSCEVSAHRHYTRAWHGLWGQTPARLAKGLSQSLTELREACQHWSTVALWLDRLANTEAHDQETLDTIRALFGQLHAQHQRLWRLSLSLQVECTQVC